MDEEDIKLLLKKGWITEYHRESKKEYRITDKGRKILGLLRALKD
jgi:DNA-binding PadR family transcriptional regulator